MKNKSVVPNNRERVMRDNDFIVSKTDLTGRITYGNEIFIEFSGYSEAELLGTPHNISRPPDMPRAAFNLVWDTIKSCKEVFAYVKNLSKDGSYYWVFTNITPDFGPKGEIVGYYSVRRCPSRAAIDKIVPVYQQMLAAEKSAGPKDAIAAGTKVLTDLLQSTGMSYEQLVLSL